jgi:ATP-dependent DNA helicase PIF1
MAEFSLSSEQQAVLQHIERGHGHVFITGKAGTGKTAVLRHLMKTTHQKVVVCAPTGIAALNAGGSTVHNLLGLGTALPADAHTDHHLVKTQKAWLKEVDILVIDEVSMVSSDLMDSMDRVLQEVRGDGDPFGGIKVVMFGDPYQLPPVVDKEAESYFRRARYRSAWFFDAHVWTQTNFTVFELEQIHRQDDPGFKDVLNAVRDGTVTADQLGQLNHVGMRKAKDKGILLASRRAAVAERNTLKLKSIRSSAKTYKAMVNTGFGIKEPADRTIVLKNGAKVMMLNNDREERWVNGTTGVVTNVWDDEVTVEIDGIPYDVGRFAWVKAGTPPEFYKEAPKFRQIPVKLAWAVTIHKSQGLSLPAVEIDLGTGAFSPGQTYVALSRVTTPEGLFIKTPLTMDDIQVDPNVKRFMQAVKG